MYNEERKSAFMENNGLDHWKFKWATSVFNTVEHYERELGIDIAEMTAEEVSKALVTSDITSHATISNRTSFIVRYKEWCAEHGFKSVHIDAADVHVDFSDNIRETMVCSEKQLVSIFEKAFPEKSENDSKCIYKAHLWLGYAGMQDLDTVRVRSSDIDFNQCAVFLDNKMYYFPEEGKRDIRHASEMEVFVRVVNGKPRTFRRSDGDTILRGRIMTNREIDDKAYLAKTLRSAVQVGFVSSGYSGMSFVRVRRSGIFREAFRREVKGIPVNFYEVGHDDFVFTGKKPTQGQTKQKILRRIILTYEKDYEAWKRAFEKELKEEFGLTEIPHQFEW